MSGPVLDWLIARTPVNRPIVPRDLVRRSIARIYWPPVTRLDRLTRSTRDLLNTLAAITGKDYAEEALSVVHSLNLRSALGIFF